MSDEFETLRNEIERPLNEEEKALLEKLDNGYLPSKVALDVPGLLGPIDVGSFILTFKDLGSSYVKIQWSPILEKELLRRHIKMTDPTHEALRGGLLLSSNIRVADVLFGDGYVNHVLWDVINDRFGSVEPVKDLLDRIPHYSTLDSPALTKSRHFLKSAIDGYGNSLVVELGYPDDGSALGILIGSVCYLLDRRFRISERQALFPEHVKQPGPG